MEKATGERWYERNWADLLWPLGGTVLGLIVVPVAIAQYPHFFNENAYLLPISVVVVLVCWCIPLILHRRARRFYSEISAKGKKGKTFLVVISAVLLGLMILGGTRLLRFHQAHLRALSAPPPSSILISWNDPAPIVVGTPLTSTQLNATANVDATPSYDPDFEKVLPVGTHTLSVTFIPKDTSKYATASKTVTLVVNQKPDITTQKTPKNPITSGHSPAEATLPHDSIPPAHAKPEPSNDQPPTLLDLYQNDFPQISKVHQVEDPVGISWNDGTVTHIKEQVYLDFDAKAQFVGFYIPAANPMVSTQTVQACLELNQNDAVEKAIDNLSKQVMLTSGRADQMTNAMV